MAQNYQPKQTSNRNLSSAARARARLQKRRERERRRKMTIAAIAVTTVLVIGLAVILIISGDNSVEKYEGIYPNVFSVGVDLSGMSQEEAAEAIRAESQTYFVQNKVTIHYGNESLPVYASEVGMKLDAEATAAAAFAYGRDLETIERKKLIKGNGEKVVLANGLSLDEDLLEQKVDAFIAMVGDQISVCSYELTDTHVIVDLSDSGQMLDKATIKNDVKEMFLSEDYNTYEAIPITITPENLRIDEIYQSVCTEPTDAYLAYIPASWEDDRTDDFDADGYTGKLKYVIRGGTEGLSFDLDAAKAKLASAGNVSRFEFALIKTTPAVSKDDIQNKIYRDVLSSYSTKLTKDKGRTENIRLAAEQVNGTEIMPGQIFSYNETVGQRTEEKGYQKAAIFVKGEVVDDIGGGICQLSSTIYITTLLSDLQQVERSPHRYAVTYTPLGQDATVAWGSLDYKFKNDKDYPIKLKTYLDDGMVKVILYGTKTDDYTYKLYSTEDEKVEYDEADKYVAFGSEEAIAQELTTIGQTKTSGGKYGYKSTTYLITLDSSGNEVARKQVNKSTYRTQTKTTYICCVLDASGMPILNDEGKPYDPNAVVPDTPTEPATEPTSSSEVTSSEEPPTPDAG